MIFDANDHHGWQQPGLIAGLAARVLPPPPLPDHVARPRLEAQLRESLRRSVTLVIAPPGFGKTTLLASWRARVSEPVAWITLSSQETYTPALVRGIIEALRSAGLPLDEAAESMLRYPDPEPAILAGCLADDLARLHEPAVLVLDDYHRAESPGNDAFIAALIGLAPGTLRLVILSRTTPNLPIAALRARGLIAEIDPKSLRFDADEAARFLAASGFAPAAAAALLEHTSGWPVALRLASFALGQQEGGEDNLPDITTSADLEQFLLDEVLASMPANLLDLLLRTSVLRRITVARAAALMPERTRGQLAADLRELANRFRVLSPDTPDAYRVHDLLREALAGDLARGRAGIDLAQTHLIACRVCEAEGAIEEALGHAVAADRADVALAVLGRHVDVGIDARRMPEVMRWLRLLPGPWIASSPRAIAAVIESETASGSLQRALDMTRLLREVAPGIAEGADPAGPRLDPLEIDCIAFRFMAIFFPPAEIIDRAGEVLERLPRERAMTRARAVLWRAFFLRALGRPEQALEELDALEAGIEFEPEIVAMHIHWAMLAVHYLEGQPGKALRAAEQMRLLAQRDRRDDFAVTATMSRGILELAQANLQEAEAAFEEALAMRTRGSLFDEMEATFGLALIHQVNGRPAQANELIDPLAERANASSDPLLSGLIEPFRARLALLRGHSAQARRWLDLRFREADRRRWSTIETATLTAAHILVRTGTREDVPRIVSWLEPLVDTPDSFGAIGRIRARLLLACAYSLAGTPAMAQDVLRSALAEIESGGYQWPLVEYREDLVALAERLGSRGSALRRHLEGSTGAPVSLAPDPESFALLASALSDFRLTRRELQTLHLMCAGKTNKEIAAILFIAADTVRQHTMHIYEKLGVENRTGAAALVSERRRALRAPR